MYLFYCNLRARFFHVNLRTKKERERPAFFIAVTSVHHTRRVMVFFRRLLKEN